MRSIISFTSAVAILIAMSHGASADPPAVDPTGVGTIPQLGIASADGQGVEIRYTIDKVVMETTLPPLDKLASTAEGQIAVRPRQVVEQRVRVVELGQLSGRHADGTAVSKDDLAKAFAKPTAILLGRPGQKIDPIFLSMLKPETLVVELPVEQARPQATAPQKPTQLAQPPRPANPSPAPVIPRKLGS